MSYTPTNWKAGDIVTSAKLNKMEQGIATSGRIRIVHLTEEDTSSEDNLTPLRAASSKPATPTTDPILKLDITPNELMDAFDNEEVVIIIAHEGFMVKQFLLYDFVYNDKAYIIRIYEYLPFTSSDPDEYFTYDPNSGSSSDTPLA